MIDFRENINLEAKQFLESLKTNGLVMIFVIAFGKYFKIDSFSSGVTAINEIFFCEIIL